MLHKTIFNNNSQRNGLLNQSYLVQLYLHCESWLTIIPCNISLKSLKSPKNNASRQTDLASADFNFIFVCTVLSIDHCRVYRENNETDSLILNVCLSCFY
jgi:hypothetical protein